MRGEDGNRGMGREPEAGLPPRARGRRLHTPAFLDAVGTTPACAGKTRTRDRPDGRGWDYPRVRGEDRNPYRAHKGREGLPPRARGRPTLLLLLLPIRGTTPACAGKTGRCSRLPRGPRDYPRVRGEDVIGSYSPSSPPGLPPRARGRPAVAADFHAVRGTTPACAGKTRRWKASKTRPRDYPRVRGEDAHSPASWSLRVGLPPRARGRRFRVGGGEITAGTTPACAGKTCPGAMSPALMRDYPRVRGEDWYPIHPIFKAVGLPPRARGRLLHGK